MAELDVTVRDAADKLASELREGRGGRAAIGSKEVAWGWTGGLPVTIASFVNSAKADNLTSTVTKVTPSGTPVAIVAAGGIKPNAVAIASDTIELKKFAGIGKVQLEQVVNGAGLLPAIVSVLGAGSLLAFETYAMGVLAAEKGGTATGADWASALVAGQASVLGNGGVPSVMVVSAADYGALTAAIVGSAGFATDPGSAIGSYLGSLLHVSPRLTSGKAYVLDASAALAVEHVDSPLALLDPYSEADTNHVRLVSDVLAGFAVVNSQHVVEVSVA